MLRLLICLSMILQGCASHAVRCESHLQPVNSTSVNPIPVKGAP